ncbi:uncharacterized protein LOC111088801 [Limulus polyphemus]|uniref:Uncharacterized protein LOC111088801 n=1 Tax=Limulus polyphemus TaxID=6850 RepID=A0ABM1TI22_LIMPO|nr:uncharacterized protein LOC111088801 [Limulus polyphemus]
MQKEEKARQNPDDGTARERHKLVRILSKQTLYRTASTQEIRPRPRLVSLSRQMSHDPSSPLPCHDWGDYDDPLPPVLDPEDPATGRPKYNRMQSSDSTRSHGSGSIHLRHSWRRPPSRLNSKISVRTSEDLIEEEDEEQAFIIWISFKRKQNS